MGGRDHSCETCGRGGLNDPDGRCICAPHDRMTESFSHSEQSCRGYVHGTGGVRLARGGKERRHRHCKRNATTTRVYVERNLSWESERTVDLCGVHAKMFDEGQRAFLRSDW